MTARLYGPSRIIAIDLDDNRLARAHDFGATDIVNSGRVDWKEQLFELAGDQGVDVAIEAVDIPRTFTMATEIIRPGGRVANVGVHGHPVEMAIDGLWIKIFLSRWVWSTPTRCRCCSSLLPLTNFLPIVL